MRGHRVCGFQLVLGSGRGVAREVSRSRRGVGISSTVLHGAARAAVATAEEEPEEGQDGDYAHGRGADGDACYCTG